MATETKMKPSLKQCALVALILSFSSGAALQCWTCSDELCSSQTSVTCSSAQTLCVSASLSVSNVTGNYSSISKGCASSDQCPSTRGQYSSIKFTEFSQRLIISCCDTDDCNSGNASFSAPPAGSLQCYSCDPNLSECAANVSCDSGQSCFHSRVSRGSGRLHGCVSDDLCNSRSSLLYSTMAPLSCCSTAHCNTPVRLVGSNNSCSGRVEVFLVDHWGTVCDDYWDLNNAKVVCRQLGCGSAVAAARYAHFGRGSGWIWMDNVHCSGNETSLSECPHNGFGVHNCRHYEDAGVICAGANQTEFTSAPVRLVGSNNSCSGRVEVFLVDHWGTVCDDYWDLNNAKVVCRQLGCGSAVAAPRYAHFGRGSGWIWMDNVHCSGNETSLSECPHNGFGVHNCRHYEDAGVICAGASQTTTSPSPEATLQCWTCSDESCSSQTSVTCSSAQTLCVSTSLSDSTGRRLYGCVSENLCNNASLSHQHLGNNSLLSCCNTSLCNLPDTATAASSTTAPGSPTTNQTTPGSPTTNQNRTTPDRSTPNQTTPDQITSNQTATEPITSNQTTPDQATTDQTTPDQATPDQSTTDQATPHGNTLEQTTLDQVTPDRTTSDDSREDDDDDDSVFCGAHRVLPVALLLPLLQLYIYTVLL